MKTLHVETLKKTFSYEDEENVKYTFEIGDENGVLLIIALKHPDTVISIPDEEEVVRAFGMSAWEGVWYSGEYD